MGKRLKIVMIISAAAFLVAGVYGVSKRDTYTNITAIENPRDAFQVAVLKESYIKIITPPEEMEAAMMEASESVVRVEALHASEIIFGTSRQKVVVKEVLFGKQELVGTEITLVLESGGIFWDAKSINMGFCNEMQVGEEYLVYIMERVDTIDERENVYLIPGIVTSPIFAYEPRESQPLGNFNYVSYSKVSDYEYFAQSQEGLDALLNLRKYVMEKWGQ